MRVKLKGISSGSRSPTPALFPEGNPAVDTSEEISVVGVAEETSAVRTSKDASDRDLAEESCVAGPWYSSSGWFIDSGN
jgi:hypothetical protein